MKYINIPVLFILVGAGFGLLATIFFPNIMPEGVATLVALGGILGLLLGILMDCYIQLFFTRSQALSRPKGKVKSLGEADLGEIEPPDRPSIRQRLAHYFRCDEKEVMTDAEPYQSKMPFWSAIEFIRQAPPKSAVFIRLTLLRIQRMIRSR